MNDKPSDPNKLASIAFDEALAKINSVVAVNASMKDGAIEKLIASFENTAQIDDEGVEFWYERDLQKLLEYSDYRNFLNIVEKAKTACINSGQPLQDHFVDVTDMIEIGKGASRT